MSEEEWVELLYKMRGNRLEEAVRDVLNKEKNTRNNHKNH